MKKLLLLFCTLILCTCCFVSCDFSWSRDNLIAQVVLDYEKSYWKELNNLKIKNPEYNYYFNGVEQVCCYFDIDGELSASDIIVKYDIKNLFANSKVTEFNSLKMISIIFDRNEFTEGVHNKLKKISREETSIENLHVEMKMRWEKSYLPKIEYYTNNAKNLNYIASPVISVSKGTDVILKSKDEYDAYFDKLLEIVESVFEKDRITAAKDLYDDSFFEQNALIITKMITRSSGSIKLTVNNLYVSDNIIYVVIRTDVPTMGTADMKNAVFGFAVAKSDVVNVDKVVTLE